MVWNEDLAKLKRQLKDQGAEPPRPAPAPKPNRIPDYKPVTAATLTTPSDADWPTYRRTYDGNGYSPLAQINTGNVKQLVPAWTMSTGFNDGHEAAPQVVNGVMFAATAGNQVLAINAATGELLWRYQRKLPDDMFGSHPTSRGVGLWGDKVFFYSRDAVLVAIDAKTGNEVWSTAVADYHQGYYANHAPLVVDGKLMVGSSGGERGIRGFVAAYDAETGKQLWRTYMVPAPGEPGSETWPKNDAWKTGGGSTWITGTYDPGTKTVYWGTGNGGPWMGDQRPGDNLYTTSVVALDVDSGKMKSFFQYHPNDSFDWDEVDAPLLVDVTRDGKTFKGLVHAGRDGVLWLMERAANTGAINFVEGKPYVYADYIKSLDPKTGRIEYNPGTKPGTGVSGKFCPSFWGGKDYQASSYSQQTKMLYIPLNANLCSEIVGAAVTYEAGRAYTGTSKNDLIVRQGADHIGEIQAWDLSTGKLVWQKNHAKSSNWGGMLTTGGGLLFTGGTNDRKFHAYDAKTGDLLWETTLNSGVMGPPSTYSVNGKQYIAVEAGWGVDAAGMQTRLAQQNIGFFPDVPLGGAIWVFEVK